MAIQQPPGDGAAAPNMQANAANSGGVGTHEVQIPVFNQTDPTKLASMGSATIENESPDSSSASSSSSTVSTSSKESTMFFDPTKATMSKTAATSSNAPASAEDVIKNAQAKAKRSSAILKGIRIAGAGIGGGGVGYLFARGVANAKAAEAAAMAGETVVVAAEAATVAAEGTVVAGEVATSTMGKVLTTLNASKSFAGVTLPVWGWIAAGAAVVATGYVVYRMVKKDDEAAAPVAETVKSVDDGVTLPQAARALGEGMVTGAVAVGMTGATVLMVGSLGSAVLAKSTATFGAKYGPIIAIGGTFVAVNYANRAIDVGSEKLRQSAYARAAAAAAAAPAGETAAAAA